MRQTVESYKFHRDTQELIIMVVLNNAKQLDDFNAADLAKFHCEACIASRPKDPT